jgi:glycosyltransferase involved in cell wall biosynthesis
VLLFPGALRIEKGILAFLRALQLSDPGPGWEFRFAGRIARDEAGLVAPALSRAREALGDRLVHQERFLSDEEYASLVREASFVILPYDRERYLYRGSAAIFDCILARTPFIGPDFGVFAYYAERYGIGLTYAAGDTEGLARRIQEAAGMDAGRFSRGFDDAARLFADEVQREGYLKLLGASS